MLRGWFVITRQNVTMGYSLMCLNGDKVSEFYPQWWMERIGVKRLQKVRFLEMGGAG